jgi:ERCC4-type nuclease
MITGILIDQREPEDIKNLKFNGIPTTIALLDYGDLWAMTDDGNMIIVERKTPDDLLNSLKDERLFPQMARMAQTRLDDQVSGNLTHWLYLVITGGIYYGPDKKAITANRPTGWDYAAVQGALVTIQEMGVYVVSCGEMDYEDTVLLLGRRSRKDLQILPARPPALLGYQEMILCSLPTIGLETAKKLLGLCSSAAWALEALTDYETQIPDIGDKKKERIRKALGLAPGCAMSVVSRKVE